MSERDELGPSAPKAFNQSEEMLELNVEVKGSKCIPNICSQNICKNRMCAKRAANLTGL